VSKDRPFGSYVGEGFGCIFMASAGAILLWAMAWFPGLPK
jgi:hypothetical protein